MGDAGWAQVLAAVAVMGVVALLRGWGRTIWVTTAEVRYTVPNGTGTTERILTAGAEIPPGDVGLVAQKREVTRSALSAIVVGRDHRTSTSKTIMFAWTLAVVYGLAALLIAKVLGDRTGWDELIRKGLQEEYLLLLGGPYAAAVLAKYAAVRQAEEGRTPAEEGTERTSQLITDDQGDTELGDFQYVIFSAIGLAYFLAAFIGHLGDGFPDLPATLTGLVLTSTGGYAAKKLLAQARPRLTSIVPASAAIDAPLQIYGSDLIVPASAAPAATALPPTVTIGGQDAPVTAHEQILGADRLSLRVPSGVRPGAGTVSVVRADGTPAVGPAGSDGIGFIVLP